MRKNGKGAAEAAPLIYSRTHGRGGLSVPTDRGNCRRQTAALPAAEGGNSSPVNTGVPAAFGGNFYDGRQFPSLTQVVS